MAGRANDQAVREAAQHNPLDVSEVEGTVDLSTNEECDL